MMTAAVQIFFAATVILCSLALAKESSCSLGCSKLAPTKPLFANVTLWIVFNYTEIFPDSTSDPLVVWFQPFEPSRHFSGKLEQLANGLYNASLEVYLGSFNNFGQYSITVNQRTLESFDIIFEPDTHCENQTSKLVHINSSAVVLSIGLNITLRCDLQGYGPTAEITWTDSNNRLLDPKRFFFTKQFESEQDANCSLYYEMLIVNPTPEDTNLYSCTLYDDDDKIDNLTTSLTILEPPKFIYSSSDQSIEQAYSLTVDYVINGNSDYINFQITINGLDSSYFCSSSQCSTQIHDQYDPPRSQFVFTINAGVLKPDLYVFQAVALFNSSVLDYYAKQYNKNPVHSTESYIRVQNGVNTPLIAGLTVLGFIVAMIVIIVVILFVYCRQFRRGYSRLSDKRSRCLLQALDTQPHSDVSKKFVNHRRFELSSEIADVAKDGRPRVCRKVFIVYFNEDPTKIEDLCDILNKLSSLNSHKAFVCDCDILHRDEVANDWNNWTEQQIREADFVLLVCSVQLHACLSQVTSPPPIQTATGLVSASAIANLCSVIRDSSRKFIPVFLNQPINTDLVPTSLIGRRAYRVNTTGLMAIQSAGLNEENFNRVIRTYLLNHREDEARDLIDLVGCLRCD